MKKIDIVKNMKKVGFGKYIYFSFLYSLANIYFVINSGVEPLRDVPNTKINI